MTRHHHLVCAALAFGLGTISAPAANASIYSYDYAGTVGAIFDAGHSGGVNLGDVANVHVSFDPALIVDVTASVNAALGTAYTDLKGASLAGPEAALSVSIATHHLGKSDQFPFAPDNGTGLQPALLVMNGDFFGVQFFGVNLGNDAFVTAGAAPQQFDFVGGDFGAAGGPSYAGNFDYKHARLSLVPEPANWSLAICGLAGWALSRRKAKAAVV